MTKVKSVVLIVLSSLALIMAIGALSNVGRGDRDGGTSDSGITVTPDVDVTGIELNEDGIIF